MPPYEEASLFTGVGGALQQGAAENEEEHPDDIPEIKIKLNSSVMKNILMINLKVKNEIIKLG